MTVYIDLGGIIMKKTFVLCLSVLMLSVSGAALAADGDIKLPAPEKSGGSALLDAVASRQSARDFEDTELTSQQLSNLLWVTAGVNREDGKLTYATASNVQDIIVYAFTREGIYRYNPSDHSLTLIEKGDHRAATGRRQAFVAKAAVDLVYAQDTSRWKGDRPASVIENCGFEHIGAATQNAYLYAASQGWGARTRMSFDHAELAQLMKLTGTQDAKLMQCVGPKPRS